MCESEKKSVKESKGFFAKLIEKLDKKMKEKSKGSCCKPKDGGGSSCCS